MEILAHINKRVKPAPQIKLPFDALLAQFTDPVIGVFVKNFTILYLEMAYARLAPVDAAAYVPALVRDISQRPLPQRLAIMHMLLPVCRIEFFGMVLRLFHTRVTRSDLVHHTHRYHP